ncbi:hypothetical protein [Herbidospora mongoliensis]|uniref:hypothetical protein n=1 Tax=Herbidospora mongoliensis TaxID=688067 RepID=UPI0008351A95|nr:hypothetical protein [Herbidospora mongoliensis]
MRRYLAFLLYPGLLSGCTGPVNGVTGLTVDTEGNLRVVLAWCGDPPETVVVYHNENDRSVQDAVYTAPPLSGITTSFRLDRPDNGWQVTNPLGELNPELIYLIFGGSADNSHGTASVHFRLADTERLATAPGRIQVDLGAHNLLTEADFLTESEEQCDG